MAQKMSDNKDEIMNEEDAVLKSHRYPNGTDGDWDQPENFHLTGLGIRYVVVEFQNGDVCLGRGFHRD